MSSTPCSATGPTTSQDQPSQLDRHHRDTPPCVPIYQLPSAEVHRVKRVSTSATSGTCERPRGPRHDRMFAPRHERRELGPSRIGVHRSVHRHLMALQPRIGQQRVDHLGRAGLTLLRSGRSSRSGTPTWPPASASATCSTTASPTSTDGSPHSRPSVSPSPRCGRRRPAPTKPPALRAGLQLAPADLDE